MAMLSEVTNNAEEKVMLERFSKRVIKDRCGNFPPLKRSLDGSLIYSEVHGMRSNRGHKLLQKSELVTRTNLNSTKPMDEECVFYNGSEHNLLQRKRVRFGLEKQSFEDCDDDEDDLNKLVDVGKILAPISSLGDISTRKHIARTFENKALLQLALQAILMVEKEQLSVVSYSKLLEVFLSDVAGPLYEDNLNLEPYDHKLEISDDEDEDREVNLEKNAAKAVAIDDNESTDHDPFFALPQFGEAETLKSKLLNINSPKTSEELETTRQLAQIALQRNQEFIRNLQKARGHLVKANRIKERLMAWSKEYSGIQEEGVTVPSALKVVKRGLISATTNRSMRDEDQLSDPEEDPEEPN